MNRHHTDAVSLVPGLLFAAAGGLLLFDRVDLVARLRWAWPVALIVLALLMILTALPQRRPPAMPATPAASEPATTAGEAGRPGAAE